MVTSASSLQNAARETRDALEEVSRHRELLAHSWRRQLQEAKERLDQLVDAQSDSWSLRARRVQTDSWTLRTIRALAATAAGECMLAARFESRLVRLPDGDLHTIGAQLEDSSVSLKRASAEAATHLVDMTEDLLAELRAESYVRDAAAVAGPAVRYQARFIDDLLAAMRAYVDRVEQILLEFGSDAHEAVGVPAGGFLPMRGSHVPPRPEIEHISAGDAAWLELSSTVLRSVELFRNRIAEQVEEATRTVQARVDDALHYRELGEQAARDRADELLRIAQHLSQLADGLDWMLLDER